jgi:hypothetical protein
MADILVKNFERWLAVSRKGDPDHTYHRGDISVDRLDENGVSTVIDFLAGRAWRAYEEGQVDLLQERTDEPGVRLYIARRR